MLTVYGKDNCGLCEAAKDKLRKMDVPFESKNIEDHTEHHDGWREDHSCEILAAYMLLDTLPVIKDGSDYVSYPQLMRRMKRRD